MHEPQQKAGFEQQQARTSKSTVSFWSTTTTTGRFPASPLMG
jgi:hypothetical protein